MQKIKRRTFDPRMKLQVIRMVKKQGISIFDVSEIMGISPNSIRCWLAKFAEEQDRRSSIRSFTAEQRRIRKLELENQKLRQDATVSKNFSSHFFGNEVIFITAKFRNLKFT